MGHKETAIFVGAFRNCVPPKNAVRLIATFGIEASYSRLGSDLRRDPVTPEVEGSSSAFFKKSGHL